MNYQRIKQLSELKAYIGSATVLSFDFETAPDDPYRAEDKAALDPYKAHIVGVSVSVEIGTGVYIPLAHRYSEEKNLSADAVFGYLKAVFSSSSVIKIAHNIAFETMFLMDVGILLQPPVYDTIVASQLTLKTLSLIHI